MFPSAIRMPPRVEVRVTLTPAYNVLNSLHGLMVAGDLDGLHPWITSTVAALPEGVVEENRVLFGGVGLEAMVNAAPAGAALDDFPAFVDALAARRPAALRDDLWHWFIHSPQRRIYVDAPAVAPPEEKRLLADMTAFSAFLSHWHEDKVPLHYLEQIHALYNDPAQLHRRLVVHLRHMWQAVLSAEWRRIRPLLEEAVGAFDGVDFGDSNVYEALQLVTGRDLRDAFKRDLLWEYRRLRFIPAVHNGPYINWFAVGDEFCIVYNARRPAALRRAPATILDQRELLERLKALADEVRLQILQLARRREEITAAEIMAEFELSSSAASRHLRQLVATGLLEEQREGGVQKVYRPVPDTIRATLNQLRQDLI